MSQPKNSSSDPANLSRRKIIGRLAWPILFSVTEIWAVVIVITQIRVDGVDAAALALVVAGVVLAIWSEWRESHELSVSPTDRTVQHRARTSTSSPSDLS